MNNFSRNNFLQSIPPVTRNLLIVNVMIWLVMFICEFLGGRLAAFSNHLVDLLGLHYVGSQHFNPVQILTYMFIHDPSNPMHVLFNMFTLWMFGRTLEHVWGARRFFLFYMVCGIGAALVQEAVWALSWQHDFISRIAELSHITYDHAAAIVQSGLSSGAMDAVQSSMMFKNSMITIGASGAIFGLLLGFAFIFPNMPLYLFFIPVPIKAKYMVIGYGVLEFFLGVGGSDSSVAHFAHLGGMIFGLILLLYWKKKGTLGGGYFG